MKTIWKYTLAAATHQFLNLPKFAQVLSVQEQHGSLVLWALVDPSEDLTKRDILVIGTGHPMPHTTLRFISTVQMEGGMLVWHIFEKQ